MPELAKSNTSQAFDALQTIVGGDSIRRGISSDNICGVIPDLYIEPATQSELGRVLEYSNLHGMQVAPRGGGTKLDWGKAPQSIDLMLSMAKFSRIVEHAPGDMTMTVEAGVTIAQLQEALSSHRQRLALDPLWPDRATVGGVVATNDSGALRIRYGSVRDLLIGVTVVLADGTIATSGGKVVKNVAGYDLPKLMTGALGTLGIIAKAVFRLHPLPENSSTLSFSFQSCESANDFMLAVTDSVLVPTGLQMRTGATGTHDVEIRIDGIDAGIASQTETVFRLAGNATRTQPIGDPWQTRESMCDVDDTSVICKLSILPDKLSSAAKFVREALGDDTEWTLLMYSTGLVWLRIGSPDCAEFIAALRSFLAQFGGKAVLIKVPTDRPHALDVWGEAGTAVPLMRKVKEQFDPHAILNRGRYVGGI